MKISKMLIIVMIITIVAQSIIIVRQINNEKKIKNTIINNERKLKETLTENKNLRSLLKIKGKKVSVIDSRIEEYLKEDLVKNAAIINGEGIKGGSFGFYDKNGIVVVNEHWVVAKFDDGHINGEMILEYKINGNKKIHWKKIASYLEK